MGTVRPVGALSTMTDMEAADTTANNITRDFALFTSWVF